MLKSWTGIYAGLREGTTTAGLRHQAQLDHWSLTSDPAEPDHVDRLVIYHWEKHPNRTSKLSEKVSFQLRIFNKNPITCKDSLSLILFSCSQMTEARIYHSKLVNVKKEMTTLHERTTKLKVRQIGQFMMRSSKMSLKSKKIITQVFIFIVFLNFRAIPRWIPHQNRAYSSRDIAILVMLKTIKYIGNWTLLLALSKNQYQRFPTHFAFTLHLMIQWLSVNTNEA